MIGDTHLDFSDRYLTLLKNYSADLETIAKLYEERKMDPVIGSNMPPIVGRILWAQHLLRKISGPAKLFASKPDIIKVTKLTILLLDIFSVSYYYYCFFLIKTFWVDTSFDRERKTTILSDIKKTVSDETSICIRQFSSLHPWTSLKPFQQC